MQTVTVNKRILAFGTRKYCSSKYVQMYVYIGMYINTHTYVMWVLLL